MVVKHLRWRRRPPPRHAYNQPPPAARRRTSGDSVAVILVLVLTSGFVAGTTATFTSQTRNPGNAFALAALSSPTGLTAVMQGTAAKLAWTGVSGTNNASAGYRVNWQDLGVPNATGTVPSACPTTTYATQITAVSTASHTDTNVSTYANYAQGRYYCYQVATIYPWSGNPASAWVSQVSNPVTPIQVGFVVNSAAITPTGSANSALIAGEKVTVTFNQPFDSATVPSGSFCSDAATDQIVLGANANTGANGATCAPGTETITGPILKSSANITKTRRYAATFVPQPVSCTTACTALLVTIQARNDGGAAVANQNDGDAPTATYTVIPSAVQKSKTGALAVCTATPVTNGLCRPTATGNF